LHGWKLAPAMKDEECPNLLGGVPVKTPLITKVEVHAQSAHEPKSLQGIS